MSPQDPEPSDSPLDALHREAEWVQKLAHRLVADPHRADDLAQDAWVALLEGGSAPGATATSGIRSPRAWMAGTLRNLAARGTRSDMRREARELAAARPEATPAADELVAEVALHRELTGVLLALDEPYRTALLLRFHRALSLEELARVQGVSLTTAHNRVKGGIELLREGLDRGRGGDRGSWVLALLPLAEQALDTAAPLVPLTPSALVGSLGIGVVAMGSTAKIAAVCLVTLGGAVGLWQVQRGPAEARDAEPALAVVPPEVEPVEVDGARELPEQALTGASVSRAVARRSQVPSVPSDQAAPLVPALVTREGRVVDLAGSPVSGVSVQLTSVPVRGPAPDDALHAGVVAQDAEMIASGSVDPVRTGADGRFRVELPRGSLGRLEVRDEFWVTVAPSFEAVLADGAQRTIIVARRGLIAGFVHDSEGVALPGVQCSLLLLDRVYAQVGIQPGWTAQSGNVGAATTGEDGRFAIEGGPTGDGLMLLFERDGYGSERVVLGQLAAESLDVELVRFTGADVFWGTVVDAGGLPVEGATVSGGGTLVKTDAAGTFRLERGSNQMFPGMDRAGTETMLRAVLVGHLPGEVQITPELASPVTLRLGAPSLTQRGRVVDGLGKPLAGVAVWSPDLTLLGMDMIEQAGSAFGRLRSVESVLAGAEHSITAADGTFELKGLLDRPYSFRAYDPRRLAVGEPVEAHPGGAAIELTLATDQLPAVAGRLLSTAGEPLVGVRVMPMRFPFGVGEHWTYPHVSTGHEIVVTDEDGAFKFDGLSTENTSLSFHGTEVKAYHAVQLAEETDLLDIEVRLGRQVSFTIDLSRDPALASQFELLDSAGEPLEILRRSGNTESSNPRMFLRADGDKSGQGAVFSVSSAARTLVLYRGEEEVGRLPVGLVPGEFNRIVP